MIFENFTAAARIISSLHGITHMTGAASSASIRLYWSHSRFTSLASARSKPLPSHPHAISAPADSSKHANHSPSKKSNHPKHQLPSPATHLRSWRSPAASDFSPPEKLSRDA